MYQLIGQLIFKEDISCSIHAKWKRCIALQRAQSMILPPYPKRANGSRHKEIKDISGFTHGVGWCAPQQGACKLSLNIKGGVIRGSTGGDHRLLRHDPQSAAMAAEILPGKTILEALNTDLVCDAINTAMRELFLQIVYGRSQSAFSDDGLAIGAGLEDLGKGLRSQVGTMYGTLKKGRPLSGDGGRLRHSA